MLPQGAPSGETLVAVRKPEADRAQLCRITSPGSPLKVRLHGIAQRGLIEACFDGITPTGTDRGSQGLGRNRAGDQLEAAMPKARTGTPAIDASP